MKMSTNWIGLFILCIMVSIVGKTAMATSTGQIRIPAEWERHNRTFMVWPASEKVWGKILKKVRGEIADIAKAIAPYEPVTIIVDPTQRESAEGAFEGFSGVDFMSIPVDDLWARDTLPIFGLKCESNEEVLTSIDFNFNGWGRKQIHGKDTKLAEQVAQKLGISRTKSKIVGEGGALELDGEGTLLVTESSWFNENRNDLSRDEIEQELKRDLGVTKVIWFDGVYNEDITDAHVDCLVRFVEPGIVILNRPFKDTPPDDVWLKSSDQAKRVLEKETDAKGRKFKIIEVYEADLDKVVNGNEKTFLASYVNFLIANDAVIVPEFGDNEADNEAQKIIQNCFPERRIVPVKINYLASGGGGIHCATHDLPDTSGHC